MLGVAVLLELACPFAAHPYGIDGSIHLTFISEFTWIFSHGVALPRWVPSAFQGFGSSSFYFYPPLAFYLAAFLHALTGIRNSSFLFQSVSILATVASFMTARLLFRAIGADSYWRNVGAILYAFAPFRVAELYTRSDLPAHVGYIFLPILAYALIAIASGKYLSRMSRILLLGVSLALVSLSNVPFLLWTLLSIVFGAIACRRMITATAVLDVTVGCLLAFGLSAFHFASVLAARPYADLGDLLLVNPIPSFWGLNNLRNLYQLLLVLLPIVFAAYAVRSNRTGLLNDTNVERMTLRLGIACAIPIAFLSVPYLSNPIWESSQLFRLLQNGWRSYIMLVLIGSTLVAFSNSASMVQVGRSIVWIWVLGALGLACIVLFNLHIGERVFNPHADPTEYRPVHTVARADLSSMLDQHESDPAVLWKIQPNEYVSHVANSPNAESFHVSLDQPHVLTFHRFQWPAWHLYMDDREVPTTFDSIGRVTALLPAGNHYLRWELQPFPLEIAGLWISGLSTIAVLGGVGSLLWTGWRKQHIK